MTLQLRACFIALALLVAAPVASASPLAFDSCPASIADLAKKLASLPVVDKSDSMSLGYQADNVRVFGVPATRVRFALDRVEPPEFSIGFRSAEKQFLQTFRERYGKGVQCMGRSCFWHAPRDGAKEGDLASAHVLYYKSLISVELACKYFRR